jgi:hypothetical protein
MALNDSQFNRLHIILLIIVVFFAAVPVLGLLAACTDGSEGCAGLLCIYHNVK